MSALSDFYKLTAGEKHNVETTTMAYLRTAYSNRRPGEREPSITAAEIADYIGQHFMCPENMRNNSRRRLVAVYNIVRRLVRINAVECSITEVNGRERRVYAPRD